jgi:hypothetical protein
MGNVHQLVVPSGQKDGDHRSAARRRVLMRCTIRMRGQTGEWPVIVKDISSTGMKATAGVNLFAGTKIEVNLPNIGWMPGEVVRLDGENAIGIRFAAIIDPEQTQTNVTGSYGAAPTAHVQLRRV